MRSSRRVTYHAKTVFGRFRVWPPRWPPWCRPAEVAGRREGSKEKKENPAVKKRTLLQVAIVGVGGRGGEHIKEFLANPHTEIAYVVDADEKIGNRRAEAIGKQQGRTPKFVQDIAHGAGRQVGPDRLDRHAQPLARPGGDLGHAGRQGRVRGKAGRHNVSEGRRMVETARKHNRICQVGTQCRSMQGTDRRHRVRQVRQDRRGEARPRPVLQAPQVDRSEGQLPGARRGRLQPLVRPGPDAAASRARTSTTTGTGSGNGATATWATRARTRWTSPAGAWGSIAWPTSAIAYGGRLGYEDAGDVANTEVGIFEFGPKTLVFEVRGLETDDLRGAKVGVIFYGSEGYVVLTSYERRRRVRSPGQARRKSSRAAATISATSSTRSGPRPETACTPTSSKAISPAPTATWPTSRIIWASRPRSTRSARRWPRLKTNEDVNDCLERTLKHLAANDVDLAKTPLTLGPMLKIDPAAETIVGNAAAAALLTREYRAPFLVPKAGEV